MSLILLSLGVIADLDLAVRSKNIKEDIMVVSMHQQCRCIFVSENNLDSMQ